MHWLYNIAIHGYNATICALSPFYRKARLWRDGRKDLFAQMRQTIDHSRPIIWIHAASLGEFEQGRPIIEKIRAERAEYQILLTFFSPSGYQVRKDYQGAHYIFYLPIDTESYAREFIYIVKPQIAIFIKYEFWLNTLAYLRQCNIRTFIVSAIFRPSSIFFRRYGGLWREALKTFETIFVQDKRSKELLSTIGYNNVIVAGDTRFDRVIQRAATVKKIDIIEQFITSAPIFIAGSTWRDDEELLIRLINDNSAIKFIIAPHEIDNNRIDKLIDSIKGGAVRYTKATGETKEYQVMILDTIGILSSVYQYANFAYIGGGFGVGIHNILEAATFGVPIAFGPNYHKFKEAHELIELKGAQSISNYSELSSWFSNLRDNETLRLEACKVSKEYTLKHKGATELFFTTLFSK